MLLKDKVIIINGVGAGLGQTLARLAAKDGAKVVLAARTQSMLDEVAHDIEKAGGVAFPVATDVADAERCEALADAVLKRFGRIDGLVNSAFRSGEKAPVDVAGIDEFIQCFDVTAMGTLRITRAVLPAMKAQASGSVVNVSTMGSVRFYANQGPYATAKGAMNVLTRYMAAEFAPHGIRVNLARMGFIGGPAVYKFIDQQVAGSARREDVVADITRNIPIGIIPPEEDCARPILFLLSDYSKVVNGAVLDINGGEFMPL